MKLVEFKTQLNKYFSSYFVRLGFLFTVYVLLAESSSFLQKTAGFGEHIWLAGGFALGCVFLWGYSLWPGIFLATVVLRLLNTNQEVPFSVQFIANLIEPLLTAMICLINPGFSLLLNRLSDVLRGLWAATLSSFFGAMIVTVSIFVSQHGLMDWQFFMRYWGGHALGLLILTPMILVFGSSDHIDIFNFKILKTKQFLYFTIYAFAAAFLYIYLKSLVCLYLFFPVVLWAALRYGQRGSMLFVFFISLLTVGVATFGVNSISEMLKSTREVFLFIFVVTLQLTGLITASYVLEQKNENKSKVKQLENERTNFQNQLQLMKKQKDAAEFTGKAKTEFLANVSHEIRTPLAAVLGFCDLLMTENMSAEEKKQCFDVIKRNGEQLTNVINDVLDLSKIQAGKFEVYKLAVPLNDIIKDLERTMTPEAQKKKLKLTITAAANIPQKIYTDSLRLRQILLNLVSNAIKFTDHGSIDISIKVVIDHEGNHKLGFIVKDTGVGIPSDKAKDIFLPFTQINTTPSRRFGGTGLGLALSQKLARSLGGKIELIQSVLGQGSEFILTIEPGTAVQIARSEKEQAEQIAVQNKKLANKKVLQNSRILIVDDSPDNQSLIQYYLRSIGADVDLASDGQQALQKVHANQYDIVLMDLEMPVMDGCTACDVMRKEGYKKPIVALTAHTWKEMQQKCMLYGFDAFLSKPVEKNKLITALLELPGIQKLKAPAVEKTVEASI